MTTDHISGFASELVQMAQAMARVPQLEADLRSASTIIESQTELVQSLRAEIQSARTYAATLEQKVFSAEASRDDAELRFLECDDAKETLVRVLDGLGKDILGALQAVQPLPQVKPKAEGGQAVSADPTPKAVGYVSTTATTTPSAPCNGADDTLARGSQGQPSSDLPSPFAQAADTSPTAPSSPEGTGEVEGGQAVIPTSSDSAPIQHGAEVSESAGPLPNASTDSVPVENTTGTVTDGVSVPSDPTATSESTSSSATASSESASTSTDASSPPLTEPVGPYTGKRYIDVPGYISQDDWLAGGGTSEDYIIRTWSTPSNASHRS